MDRATQPKARPGPKKALSPEEREELLTTLKARFEKNRQGFPWLPEGLNTSPGFQNCRTS